MTNARKKQLLAVSVIAIAGGVIYAMSANSIEQNLVYYLSPKDVLEQGVKAQGSTIRLGGVVCKNSLDWNAQTLQLRFKVGMDAEGVGPTVAVFSTSAPPQMFREGIGVVVEGRYDGSLFTAERLMVKHSNEYHPPKDGKAPHEIVNTLVDDQKPGTPTRAN
jgi:cytochrome c-type biogenesis protein CcmE